jgi:DNA-binding protein H-NS
MPKMTNDEFVAKRKKARKTGKKRKKLEVIKENGESKVITVIKKAYERVPKVIEPGAGTIEEALKNNAGLLTYTAQELNIPIEVLKKAITKNKQLRETLIELREGMVDLAEQTLLWRIKEKKDLIASMFLLKSIGKHRGWIEGPTKAGISADKPIYIRILPVNGEVNPLGGRPKKIHSELKAIPVETSKSRKEAIEEILEGEVVG